MVVEVIHVARHVVLHKVGISDEGESVFERLLLDAAYGAIKLMASVDRRATASRQAL